MAAAACVLLVWILSLQVGADARGALVAAASAAIASPLWPYSKFGFSTALTAAILLGSACLLVHAVDRDPPSAGAAGAAGAVVAFGWLTRHEMAIVLLPYVVFLLMTSRASAPRRAWRPAAALLGCALAGGLLWMWYNLARFGGPFSVGYAPGFDGSGYGAYLAAPAGSIFLFAPIAVIWLAGLVAPGATSAARRVLLVGPLAVCYLFYGALIDWPGGRSYGPRYLVPGLLLLAPGAALLWRRGGWWRPALAAAVIAGAVLQLPGVLVDYSKVSVDWARRSTSAEIAHRNWSLAASPFVLDARAALPALATNAAYLTGREPLPRVTTTSGTGDRDFAQQFSFSLDLWWLYLVYLGALTTRTAMAIAAALGVTAAACGAMAWRSA